MDVTQEIQQNRIIYGASDYTAPSGLAASKSLNYAEGPTITRPVNREISIIPYTVNYQSEVGLFGAENYFTKINVEVDKTIVSACFSEAGWECTYISEADTPEMYWDVGMIDYQAPCETENTYKCPRISEETLPDVGVDAYISVSLINKKTGNKYIDDWVDVRLYTKAREEHPYNKMYVRLKDFFYVGIHARNTRRLPFDIACVIGLEYLNYDSIEDRHLIMKR